MSLTLGGRLKVVHLVHWPRSGIGTVVRQIVRHAPESAVHTVLCLERGSPTTDRIRSEGASVIEPTGDGRESRLSHLYRFRAFLKNNETDIVHTHSFTPRVIGALFTRGKLHVTTVHSPYRYFDDFGVKPIVKRNLECAVMAAGVDRIVCVSEDVRSSVPCGAVRREAHVVRNGVDVEEVRAAASRKQSVRRTGEPQLIAVGRLDREKGFVNLLHAVERVRREFPGLALTVCGDGSQRGQLEDEARRLGIDGAVQFAGYVKNPMPLLADSDLFVASSVREGFSLAVCEAMVLGTPVATTPSSGVSTVLRDGETGFVADGFEARAISQVIVRALSDKSRLKRVASAAQSFGTEMLNVTETVREYHSIYSSVGDNSNGRE